MKPRKPIKRTPIKRKRKTAFGRKEIWKLTSSNVKHDLDIIFSAWIRMRDMDDDGNGQCISCNKPASWHHLQNGHFISRAQAPGLIFNERNCRAQCKRCNKWLEGNSSGYRETLIKRFGQGYVDILEAQKYKKSGLGLFEYKAMLLDYIGKFKEQCIRLGHKPNATQQAVLNRHNYKL